MDVSIIIPTYNRLWSLPKTVQSCREATCRTEIIVIDDGSTDGTLEWLQKQANLVVIPQQNWGKCWAVNAGYTMAKGKYVRFLDSDDMLDAGAIDEQFALAEQTGADMVVSGYKVIGEDDGILREQKWIACDDFIAQQLGECDSSHYSSYLFLKSFLKDIPHRPDYAFRDDRLLVLEAALKKPKVAFHEGTALLHRAHQSNRLQFNSNLQQAVQNYQHYKLYQKIVNVLKEKGELTPRRAKAAVRVLWPLAHWMAKHSLADANAVYQFIKSLDPAFKPEEKGALGLLYRKLGFSNTEKLLQIRRLLKNGI